MAAAKDPGISKLGAVKKALKELGKDAMPAKIQEHVKEKFGLEMTTSHVSNYKSLLLRKKKRKKAVAGNGDGVEAPAAAAAPSVKATSAPVAGSAVSLDDVAAVKQLVGRMGEEQLKSLIKVLG